MEGNINALENLLKHCAKNKIRKIGIPFCIHHMQDKDLVCSYLENHKKKSLEIDCSMCSACETGEGEPTGKDGDRIARLLNDNRVSLNLIIGLCPNQLNIFLQRTNQMSVVAAVRS